MVQRATGRRVMGPVLVLICCACGSTVAAEETVAWVLDPRASVEFVSLGE